MEIAFLGLRILMAAALYAFLGWALWLLWSGLRRQSEKQIETALPTISLALQGEEPSTFFFTRPEVIIGRQPGSDVQLDDAAVSARHTRLIYRDGQWWAEDLQSRNGTYINRERISAALALASGDEIRIGAVIMNVEISGGLALEYEDEL